MQPSPHPASPTYLSVPIHAFRYQLAAGEDPDDESTPRTPFDRQKASREDLPYRVELWDEARNTVEQVLAVTANAGIGYAAYYAATREHPQRYITLRHRNAIVSRWNGSEQ
jgi:hypothetical protein